MSNQIAEDLPLDVASDKPLVTFALFAYNQEKYIREAIEGAFAQTYSPLEIILSDDCSTDRTFEIMQEMADSYTGPHKVILNKNKKNKGIAKHYSEVVKISTGEYIAISAGDDISLPDRVSISVAPFFDDANVSFVQTGFTNFIDKRDLTKSFNEPSPTVQKITLQSYFEAVSPVLLGASRTIKKVNFSIFPELDSSCPEEDKPSIFRLLMTGPAIYLSHPLVLRRIHSANLSNAENLAKMNNFSLLNQFLDDITFAKNNHLINQKTADHLRVRLRKYVKQREIYTSYKSSKNKITHFLFSFLPSSSISFRQKLYEAKMLFLSSK